ncbi:MAG: aminoacyl-tRNA hydrolase [Bdellovibrionota bacterium]
MSIAPNIKMVVGLGNPGSKYTYTRHNLGFLTLDHFLANAAVSWSEKADGAFIRINMSGQQRIFLKPLSFMNLSGEVLRSYMRTYAVDPEEVLVVHDEADLEAGVIRLKKNGGAGGHNGLRSIIAETGSNAFYRLRIGTGKHEIIPLASFLLAKANPELLDPMAEKAAAVLEDVFAHGFIKAQQTVNQC